MISFKIDNNLLSKIEKFDYNNIDNYNLITYLFNLLKNYYKDDILLEEFSFIKQSINNSHIIYLLKFISSKIKQFNGVDVLNKFYSEFCLWDKNNESQLGIVLTPDDIAEIMVNELEINKEDKVLDFCTGTGSFLIKSSKYSTNLYGCENNSERYSLAKCNFILHNLNSNNLIFDSCFNVNYKANSFDKIIINPPFNVKCSDENNNDCSVYKEFIGERKFVIYGIELLKENGKMVVIFPRSNVNNTQKKINKFKQEILKYCYLEKTINCNSKIFCPVAAVECIILVLKKKSLTINCLSEFNEENTNKTLQIDYSEDGYKLKKKIRTKITEPNIKTTKQILKYNDDWNYSEKNIFSNEIIKEINIRRENIKFRKYINEFSNKDFINEYNIKQYKMVDLFKYIKCKYYRSDNSPNGNIPLYGATQYDEPINYINSCSINTEEYAEAELVKEYGVLCINKGGSAGYCFLRKGKFALTSSVMCFQLLKPINEENIEYISYQLRNLFNFRNKFSLNKFNELTINLFE